jgi:hypothetical protein
MAPTQPLAAFGLLVGFFVVMNIILFRAQIFKRKKKASAETEDKE